MPVTSSAKKALRVSHRRHAENLIQKDAFKQAVKAVRKATTQGSKDLNELFAKAQSTLDRAAKHHTIHPNKAARLKSRLSKNLSTAAAAPTPTKPSKVSKPRNKKTAKK